MGGWKAGGANIYLGVTRSGKTTLARQHIDADAARWRHPVATLDLETASDWAGAPHAGSADEVINALYVLKKNPLPWTTTEDQVAERAKFFRTVAHWGAAGVLVDGVPMICDGHSFEKEFKNALYKWGHGKSGPTFWYLVAQRPSLLHRNAFAACRIVHVFRQSPGADADRVLHEFEITPGAPCGCLKQWRFWRNPCPSCGKRAARGSTTFERGEYVAIELGFPEEETPPPAPPPAAPAGPPPGDALGAGQAPPAPRAEDKPLA